MACQFIFLLLGVAILSCAAVVCAAVSWSRISELSLPLPTFLPALNVLIPILAALILPLSRRFVHQVKERTIHLVLPYLAYGSTFLPFILFILSLVYATPGDIQSCSLERHWLRMFEAKNDRAIRSIQTDLQCCGLNSIHDRAWPFPSRDNDARACERTQGYVVPCGGLWRHQEAVAATLTAIASFLNWLSLVCCCVIDLKRLN